MADSSFLGTGWSFPPSFDNANHYTLNLCSGQANIAQSIDTILQTPRGSRCLAPNFGSDLSLFLFHTLDSSLCVELTQIVKTALLLNEPRITVKEVTATVNEETATVIFNIEYVLNNINTRSNHVFPFCVLEATNLPVTS